MKKHQRLINTIIVLLILVFVLVGATFYLFNVLISKNENISSLTNYLSLETNREDYVISTQKLLQSLDSDISKVRSLIVPSAGDVGFIENLEFVARNNGLTIDIDSLVIENDPKAPQATITVLRIKTKTKGLWSNTYKFITELESLPYKIKINSMVLSKTSEDLLSKDGKKITSKSQWSASIDMGVLKYK